jgi:hypothetical protein
MEFLFPRIALNLDTWESWQIARCKYMGRVMIAPRKCAPGKGAKLFILFLRHRLAHGSVREKPMFSRIDGDGSVASGHS